MKIADKPEGRKRDPLLRHIWFQISKFSLDCQTNTETKILDGISVEFTFHEIDESKTETEKNRDKKAKKEKSTFLGEKSKYPFETVDLNLMTPRYSEKEWWP